MSLLVELTRTYWLDGIYRVSGRQELGLASWITADVFQVYKPLVPNQATLSYSEPTSLIAAFAADASRMAAASIESIEGITPSTKLPKSVGWLLIRCYYAAFFAAHSILRMLGRTCTQLDAGQINSIHEIADIYGQRDSVTLTKGMYACTADIAGKSLVLRRLELTEGSHGAMWGVLYEVLGELSSSLLASGGPAVPVQRVSAKIIELRQALSDDGRHPRGTWLSFVRNRVNYQLGFGAWFPYADRLIYYESLFTTIEYWKADPLAVPLWFQRGRDLQRFIEVCALLVALCREMSQDMAKRCPRGKSFHRFGCLALLNQIAS